MLIFYYLTLHTIFAYHQSLKVRRSFARNRVKQDGLGLKSDVWGVRASSLKAEKSDEQQSYWQLASPVSKCGASFVEGCDKRGIACADQGILGEESGEALEREQRRFQCRQFLRSGHKRKVECGRESLTPFTSRRFIGLFPRSRWRGGPSSFGFFISQNWSLIRRVGSRVLTPESEMRLPCH